METAITVLFIIMALCAVVILGLIGETIFSPLKVPERINKIICISMIVFGVALLLAVFLGILVSLADNYNLIK